MRAKAQAKGGGLQGRLEEAQGKRSAGPVVKGGGGMRSGGASCRGQRGQPGAGGGVGSRELACLFAVRVRRFSSYTGAFSIKKLKF